MTKLDKLKTYWFWIAVVTMVFIATKSIWTAPVDISQWKFMTHVGHEWDYNIWRIIGLADAYAEGSNGRWLWSYSNGWGYPFFYFTPPLPYSLGALFYLAGFHSSVALNIMWMIAYLGCALAMFWAMRPVFGPWGALLATVLYTFAPYHFVDTFVRTNLPETLSFIFLPIIFRGIWLLRTQLSKGIAIGGFGVVMLILTHLISTYIIGISLIIFCSTFLLLQKKNQMLSVMRPLALIALCGFGLTAFFWIPAMIDLSMVQGTSVISNGEYHYSKHFVFLHQLIDSNWDYGGSEEGPIDYMSFSIGPIQFILFICAFFLVANGKFNKSFFATNNNEKKEELEKRDTALNMAVASIVAALGAIFFTTSYSAFLWELIPEMSSIQFPWRFLSPASFFVAASCGAIPCLLKPLIPRIKHLQGFTVLILTLITIPYYWSFAKAGAYDAVPLDHHLVGYYRDHSIFTTNLLEFMPKQVTYAPVKEGDLKEVALFFDYSGTLLKRIRSAKLGHGWAKIDLIPGPGGSIQLNQHWLPAWHASVDGKPFQTYTNEEGFAPVRVDVPDNTYEVIFEFGQTQATSIGITVSFITILLFILTLLIRKEFKVLGLSALPLALLVIAIISYGRSPVHKSAPLENPVWIPDTSIALDDLRQEKPDGTPWDQWGNKIMSTNGLLINAIPSGNYRALQLSVDGNDFYLLAFLNKGKLVKDATIQVSPTFGWGLVNYQYPIPDIQFDAIAIYPINGDAKYSLGHLQLIN